MANHHSMTAVCEQCGGPRDTRAKRICLACKNKVGRTLKRCAKCGEDKPLSDYRNRTDTGKLRSYCRPCHATWHRWYRLEKAYGLNEDAYNALLAQQGGRCAICGDPPPADIRLIHVDHNHTTGNVRGILCSPCNTALGGFRESPAILDAAKAYLAAHD